MIFIQTRSATIYASFNISEQSYCTLIQYAYSSAYDWSAYLIRAPLIDLLIQPSLSLSLSLVDTAPITHYKAHQRKCGPITKPHWVSHESCGSSMELNYERTPEEKEIVSIFSITKEWSLDDIASPNGACIALAREMRRITVELFHVNRVSAYSFL